MSNEEISNIIRYTVQDLLDGYELKDGSYAIEYIGDDWLDILESCILQNLNNRDA